MRLKGRPIIFTVLAFISSRCLAADKTQILALNKVPDAKPPSDASLVVPAYLANQEFFHASATFRVAQRVQQVYKSSEFKSGPIWITGIAWRPSPNSGCAFKATITNIQVNLSMTSRQPDNLSTEFSENIGFDNQIVFSGPLKISSQFRDAVGGTKKFDMVVAFQRPFYYDPSRGNLLLDIHNFQNSDATYTDCYGKNDDGGSRVVALDPNSPSASFSDTGVDPIQIPYTTSIKKEDHPPSGNLSIDNTISPLGRSANLLALSPKARQ